MSKIGSDHLARSAIVYVRQSSCAVKRRRFSSGCKPRPANRSSRKQPGQAWRQRNV